MDTRVIAWAVVATTCYHEHMHKNTLGDAANGQKNHRSLLIVPLSRRSRVGRLATYVCAVLPQRRRRGAACRWAAGPRPPPTLAEQQNLSPRWRRESPRESICSYLPSGAGLKVTLRLVTYGPVKRLCWVNGSVGWTVISLKSKNGKISSIKKLLTIHLWTFSFQMAHVDNVNWKI